MTDKQQGVLLGCALGDALGAPHEFNHSLKYTGLMEFESKRFRRFDNDWIVHDIGQYTDDTELTIIVHRLVKDGYTEEKAVMAYIHWVNNKCPHLGKNTAALFRNIKTYKGFLGRREKEQPSESNGALMRCAPFAFSHKWKQWAAADTALTNPTPVAIDCTLTHLVGIRYALLGCRDTKKILRYMINACTTPEVREVLEQGQNAEKRDVVDKKGWCLHAMYFDALTLAHCKSFSQAMNLIITSGGDTDTNAAIVGALWGAIYGRERLEKDLPQQTSALYNCTTEPPENPADRYTYATRPENLRASELYN